MGFRTTIHRWLLNNWEEPFLKAELERVEINKTGGERGEEGEKE